MKRKVMIFGLFIFVALVSAGCFGGGSTDSLRCTFEEEDYGMMTSGEYVIDFENDKPIKVTMVVESQFESQEEAEMFYGFSDEMYDDMFEEEGVRVTTSLDGDTVKMTITIDERDTEHANLHEDFFGLSVDETITKASMKADLEAEGFICN